MAFLMPSRRMRVRLDAQAERTGFVHCGVKFFGSELAGVGIAAVREDGAAGKKLDVIRTVVRELTDNSADLPRTVGDAVAKIPRERNVGRKAGHGAGAAGDGEVCAGDEHARAGNVPAIDGVAQSDIGQSTIDADVAHGGETGFEHAGARWARTRARSARATCGRG